LLDLVGLLDRRDIVSKNFGGEQQRVAIVLLWRQTVITSDEPTGELDTVTAQTIYDLLRDLNTRLGLTMVIVSHDPGIAKHVDRVVAVRDGKLASETVRVQRLDGGEHHVELAVLDSAGRLQLPREYLEEFDIKRRVIIETTAEGILIRKPDESHHQGEHGVSSSEQVETEEEAVQVPSKLNQVWSNVMSMIRKGLKR
jgi:ABC-type methionine transport system ATPase subunit